MPNLRNDYTEGVGKSVLELFKKVFQIKKDHVENELENSQTNPQTGGTGSVETLTVVEDPVELESGHVKLTNVSQYYDGTIYEGILNYDKDYDISFNIKDRTKGHFSPPPPPP